MTRRYITYTLRLQTEAISVVADKLHVVPNEFFKVQEGLMLSRDFTTLDTGSASTGLLFSFVGSEENSGGGGDQNLGGGGIKTLWASHASSKL